MAQRARIPDNDPAELEAFSMMLKFGHDYLCLAARFYGLRGGSDSTDQLREIAKGRWPIIGRAFLAEYEAMRRADPYLPARPWALRTWGAPDKKARPGRSPKRAA